MSSDRKAEKLAAARRALEFVAPGMAVGLGSGSTAALFVELLGEKVRAGLTIRAVPSSSETRRLAQAAGIPLCDFEAVDALDVTVDGADEIDPAGNMIKGRGAALLYEKILAAHSRRLVIAIDPSKQVGQLGGKYPVPVEVIPLARPLIARALAGLGARVVVRGAPDAPFVTDEGNHLLDCHFGLIADPAALAARLDTMVGVVEHGLFLGFKPTLVVGT